jgi:hypothetical protein
MKYSAFTTIAFAALPLLASARRIKCGNEQDAIPQFLFKNYQAIQGKHFSNETIEIGTWMHVVSSKKAPAGTTAKQIKQQLETLNRAFEKTGFRFRLEGTNEIINRTWSEADGDHEDKREMKAALHKGTYKTLNLYFVDNVKIQGWIQKGDISRGRCPYPDKLKSDSHPNGYDLKQSGCLLHIGTMPGGTMKDYNFGYTAVHEVGHFLGLLHVFEGESCRSAGDLVDDTLVQDKPTYGCTAKAGMCKRERPVGVPAMLNYMDYADDICLEGFTPDQILRMKFIWSYFRAKY